MRKIVRTTCLVGIIVLASCGGNKPKEEDTSSGNHTDKTTTTTETPSDVIMVDDHSVPYPSDSIALILEKAGLCKCDTAAARKAGFAPCDASLFRYFKNSNEPITKGFLVEIRPMILSKTYRIVNIALQEDGTYKVSNDYMGELLELHPTKKGKYDLVIRYYDKSIKATVALLHTWHDYHYEPTEVLEINNYFVKKESKDSLNEVYVKNFRWGF